MKIDFDQCEPLNKKQKERAIKIINKLIGSKDYKEIICSWDKKNDPANKSLVNIFLDGTPFLRITSLELFGL